MPPKKIAVAVLFAPVLALAGCGGAAGLAEQSAAPEPAPIVAEKKRGEVHEWAIADNASAIRSLREGDPRINAGDENGWTPLHWAAFLENADAIDALLNRGANPNAQAKSDESEFSDEAMKTLVDLGVIGKDDADSLDKVNSGDTVLGIAVYADSQQIIAALVEGGADVHKKDGQDLTALHIAANADARAVAYELIERGANIEARGFREWTPLHVAATENSGSVIAELIVRKAKVNARDQNSLTPLHLAALSNAGEAIKELAERDANLEARDEDGDTPLHLAVHGKKGNAIVELILAGANINAWDDKGYTPLHRAAQNNHADLIEILCERGAHVNARDEDGDTPLHWAALNDFPEAIRVLAAPPCEADVNIENRRRETPLDLAVHEEKLAAIRELQKYNAQRGDTF